MPIYLFFLIYSPVHLRYRFRATSGKQGKASTTRGRSCIIILHCPHSDIIKHRILYYSQAP